MATTGDPSSRPETTTSKGTRPLQANDGDQIPIISTGNNEIDVKLGGGIPVRSLTLIEGQSASGKSVLSQQFIWGSLWADSRVVLYTTERTVSGHVRQMESLGLDISDYLLMGALKVFPIDQAMAQNSPQLLSALVENMARHESYDLIIVDSLTPMVTPSSIIEVVAFFEQCRRLCSQGKTIVVTLHAYSIDESGRDRIRSMCDADLYLRIDTVGDQLVNVLEVMKVSGATMTTGNVVSFAVEPMIGLRIIPLSYTRV